MLPQNFYQPEEFMLEAVTRKEPGRESDPHVESTAAPITYYCSYPAVVILDHNNQRRQFKNYQLTVNNTALQRYIDENYTFLKKVVAKVKIGIPA